MTAATIEQYSPDVLTLSGQLIFPTVTAVYQQGISLINKNSIQTIDFGGVTRSDSSALALIIELLRVANDRNSELKFINMPQQLCAIARVSGLQNLLCI